MTANEPAIERLESLGAELDDYRDPTGKEPIGQLYATLKNWRGSSRDLELLGKIPKVSDLFVNASNSPLRDPDVERLAGLPALRVLDLSNTRITGTALRHLKGAKDLHQLWLRGTRIADADLDAIGELSRLSTLDISRTRVKGQLVAIPESVERLMLDQTLLEGLELVAGASRPALVDLRLDETPLTDTMLNDVEKCPNLGILWLQWTRVTDRGLVAVGRLRKLYWLRLDGLDITDAGLEALSGLSDLASLSLSRDRITDKGLDALAGLRKLRLVDPQHPR
ncbi:MAG: hypothetical protein ACLP9L_18755 [Thermoguttaceae bacterium]